MGLVHRLAGLLLLSALSLGVSYVHKPPARQRVSLLAPAPVPVLVPVLAPVLPRPVFPFFALAYRAAPYLRPFNLKPCLSYHLRFGAFIKPET